MHIILIRRVLSVVVPIFGEMTVNAMDRSIKIVVKTILKGLDNNDYYFLTQLHLIMIVTEERASMQTILYFAGEFYRKI